LVLLSLFLKSESVTELIAVDKDLEELKSILENHSVERFQWVPEQDNGTQLHVLLELLVIELSLEPLNPHICQSQESKYGLVPQLEAQVLHLQQKPTPS